MKRAYLYPSVIQKVLSQNQKKKLLLNIFVAVIHEHYF